MEALKRYLSRTFPKVLNVHDETVSDPQKIADILNVHFTSISKKYVSSPKNELTEEVCHKLKNYVEGKVPAHEVFAIPQISPDFVIKQLRSLNTAKATGLDGISAKVLKMTSPAIIAVITYICNLSIEVGQFPSKWKEAKVVPIFKSGSRSDCNNYRPISVLPVLSKILEKHVYCHLYKFLQDHNLLMNTQFGFRKDHSCQTAVLSITEQIYQAINEGKFLGLVQLDFSKAFDLVNHKLLLEKLKLYRCNTSAINWFTSYLCNRMQKVVLTQTESAPSKIVSGVPQGSILGPLLFLMFINDMPELVSQSQTLLYADDVTFAYADTNVETIEENLNENCQSASDWGMDNDMYLNAKKCNSTLFATKQKLRLTDNTSLKIKINNDNIPHAQNTKLLGVHLDSELTWKDQITHVHNEVVKNIYLLKQIKEYLSINDRKLFYNSYIQPHLDYCNVIWGNCAKYLLNDLCKLQKRAARLILGKDISTPSHELFSELNWMPLEERISFNRSVQVFKCLHKLCPKGLQNVFTPASSIHSHPTRSAVDKNNLYIPPVHTKSFSYLGATTWNGLPSNVRNTTSINSFKHAYITYYKGSQGLHCH